MTPPTFVSYGHNGEDVVLWRALHGVVEGRYVDVGAGDPSQFSVSMAFYAMGWSGVTVEADPELAARHRTRRPRDLLIEAAVVGGGAATESTHERADSTVPAERLDRMLTDAGWAGRAIHFMSLRGPDIENDVLKGIDLRAWRPWVLVIGPTSPADLESRRGPWEAGVLQAGYRFCLFDGLSLYYVSEERADELADVMSYPACPRDDYVTVADRDCREQAASAEALVDEVSRWRTHAMTRWANGVASSVIADQLRMELAATRDSYAKLRSDCDQVVAEAIDLQHQIVDLRSSTSWRATLPLRVVSSLVGRARAGNRRPSIAIGSAQVELDGSQPAKATEAEPATSPTRFASSGQSPIEKT